MITKIKENWLQILDQMKKDNEISDASYKAWLKPLSPYSILDNTLYILVNDEELGQRYIEYIEKKYTFPIKAMITDMFDANLEIKYILPSQTKDIDSLSSVKTSGKTTASAVLPKKSFENTNLNSKYTFDTFVVGENNRFAHAAALAVAETPADAYNPLFIYGSVGLGKTHLMQSIGNFIFDQSTNKKIMYVTSEKFTNDLVEAIKTKQTEAFRDTYRKVDVLLIDDIQFISGKDSTQEEFFHTFNELHASKKQIVIASDRPPKDISTLEERLRSRFQWGLIVDIAPPSFETRMAILHKKAESEGLNIPNEILEYIANNIRSNIRELEGSLTKLTAYAKFTHNNLSIALAEEALRDLIFPDEVRDITPDLIIKVVADHFGITPNDILSHKRNQSVANPRQIAMYLCNTMTNKSYDEIGKALNKDHTTILHGVRKISNSIQEDPSTKELIDILKKKISPA